MTTNLLIKQGFLGRSRLLALGAYLLPSVTFAQFAPDRAIATPSSLLEHRLALERFPAPLRSSAEKLSAALVDHKLADTAPEFSELERELQEQASKQARGLRDEAYHLLGVYYEVVDEKPKAVQAYEKSLLLVANQPDILFRLGIVKFDLGDFAQAASLFEEVAWRRVEYKPEALYMLARCQIALQREPLALKNLEKAVELNPSLLPALQQLVALRQKMLQGEVNPKARAKLEEKIAADLERIRQVAPNDKDALIAIVRKMMRNVDPLLQPQRLAEAEGLALQLAESSQYRDPEAVKLLFDVYLRRGEAQKAEQCLSRAKESIKDQSVLAAAYRQLEIQKSVLQQQEQAENSE